MVKTLVTYATDYGNTKKMAESIAAGAQSISGTQLSLKPVDEITSEDFLSADAILVGTPVHMGSPEWKIKKMIDTICSPLWMKDRLIGKVGGVFSTGGGFGSAGGGCELTLLALLANFAELGLLIVPLPKNTPGYRLGGLHWGPYARSSGLNMENLGVSPESLEAAFHHGANVTRVAAQLKGLNLFAKNEAMVTHS